MGGSGGERTFATTPLPQVSATVPIELWYGESGHVTHYVEYRVLAIPRICSRRPPLGYSGPLSARVLCRCNRGNSRHNRETEEGDWIQMYLAWLERYRNTIRYARHFLQSSNNRTVVCWISSVFHSSNIFIIYLHAKSQVEKMLHVLLLCFNIARNARDSTKNDSILLACNPRVGEPAINFLHRPTLTASQT